MHHSQKISTLIHENFRVVISYAVAKPILAQIVERRFEGDWRSLDATLNMHSEEQADRALLEMAIQIRALDDIDGLNDKLKRTQPLPLGKVTQSDDSTTELYLRDLTNKIIHSSRFEWCLEDSDSPIVILHSQNPSRWKTAAVELIGLMAFVGILGR